MVQLTFKRYEIKYLLTSEQKNRLRILMDRYMVPDEWGPSTVCNVYYDTPSRLLVRRSAEHPDYKEKVRVRSYGIAKPDAPLFVELKKKYDDVVYKRRITAPNDAAMQWLGQKAEHPQDSQIAREIDYVLNFYGNLKPTVFLSYEREAYYCTDGSDFRVTFDDHILCREDALSLTEPVYGTAILPDDKVLMEIKCSGGIPMWMIRFLSQEKIYKTSFSKYGTAYQTLICPRKPMTEEKVNA
jgi:hypothetical protein